MSETISEVRQSEVNETGQTGTSKPARERFWREQVSNWHDSGLGQSAYCRQRGLKLHQFLYWRRKLEGLHPSPKSATGAAFVPVRVAEPAGDGQGATLSVSLPNGVVVRGISAGNVDLLGRLLRQL